MTENNTLKTASAQVIFQAVLVLLPLVITVTPAFPQSRIGIKTGHTYLTQTVRNMSELRWNKLTRQGWDISCGAASLSTLLTYHNQHPFSELAITLSILKNTDPNLIKERGGFSLFDLKRFVRAIGFEGLGFGDMTLSDLSTFTLPAILPIRLNDFDHFVVFKKRIGNHVLIGDPAFGNISLSAAKFEDLWKSRIAFYVVTSVERKLLEEQPGKLNPSPLSPEAMEIAIPNRAYGSRILNRIPFIPITRRSMVSTP